MDIERFLEMFKEESDLDPKKLLRAYLNHHIKNSTQEQITQPKVLEIRCLLWEIAIEIENYNLLKHIIHCHHLSIHFFESLFECGNEELIGFFVVIPFFKFNIAFSNSRTICPDLNQPKLPPFCFDGPIE